MHYGVSERAFLFLREVDQRRIMGVSELLEAIEARGKEERKKILSRSNKTAKRLIEEAEARAKEISESILEQEDPELEVTRTKILGESELKKTRSLAQVKNQLVEEVFDKARQKLSKVRERNDYKSILHKLGDEVLTGEDLIICVDKRDIPLIQNILASRNLNAEVRPGQNSLGGLVVETEDGSISVHNTIESRLEKRRESLAEELNQILFEGE
jgi:V/A-type H+-transporting ATPase subunit E